MLRLLAGWLASTQSLVRRATLKMTDVAPSPKRSRLEEDRVSEVQELVLQPEKSGEQSSECGGVAEEVRSKDVGVAEEDGGVAKDGSKARTGRKRKCVLLMAYNGKGYLGMQRNPGVLTIEEELLSALVKTKAIPTDDLGKIQFQRCARTDKGVSAARQLVSLKMVAEPALVGELNTHLPDQIRVLGLQRVNRSFNSKNACSGRTYEYLTPTYAFAPFRLTTLDYRIDGDTMARMDSLLQHYVGTHNFHNFTSGKKFEDNSSNRYIISFQSNPPFLTSSTCGSCAEKKEVEFVSLKVKGQSFMIHQIRKMIGLVIAVVRGLVGEEVMTEAFARKKIDIPRAPALGLLLENVHFDGYNRRLQHFAVEGIHCPLDWTPYEAEAESFKREHIHRSIIDEELSQLSMMQWIGSLQIHGFYQTQARLAAKQQGAGLGTGEQGAEFGAGEQGAELGTGEQRAGLGAGEQEVELGAGEQGAGLRAERPGACLGAGEQEAGLRATSPMQDSEECFFTEQATSDKVDFVDAQDHSSPPPPTV